MQVISLGDLGGSEVILNGSRTSNVECSPYLDFTFGEPGVQILEI